MKLSLLKRPTPRITFTCRPEDEGVITPPVRAKTVLPEWFRKLPAVTEDKVSPTDSGLTVKRCMPFLDAMMAGWVIGLPATVRMEIADVRPHGELRLGFRPHACQQPCEPSGGWQSA